MEFRTLSASALACSLMFYGSVTLAADKVQEKAQSRDQTQSRVDEPIFGSQLMTEQERIEHRNRMRSLKTYEEREAFRLEHHKKMLERAKARGVMLPEEPMPRGGMMMGPGGGMGPGSNRK
jgi:hypothetical protein